MKRRKIVTGFNRVKTFSVRLDDQDYARLLRLGLNSKTSCAAVVRRLVNEEWQRARVAEGLPAEPVDPW